MKMLRAVIWPEKEAAVASALAQGGFPAMTKWDVLGRGKQQGVQVGGQLYDELAKSMLMMVIEDQPGGGGGADYPGRSVHRFPRRWQDVRIGCRCRIHLADRAKRPLETTESDADCQRPVRVSTSGPDHVRVHSPMKYLALPVGFCRHGMPGSAL